VVGGGWWCVVVVGCCTTVVVVCFVVVVVGLAVVVVVVVVADALVVDGALALVVTETASSDVVGWLGLPGCTGSTSGCRARSTGVSWPP
jgi:hypothetical protein